MNHQALIRWLKECFREDHTRAGLRDFMASSIENRFMVKDEDKLACGFLDEDVFSPAYAEKLALNLSLHQREKELIYGCLFFVGKVGGHAYRAPLIIYPAEADENGSMNVVSIKRHLYRVNYSLLDVLDNKKQIEQRIIETMEDSGGLLTSLVVSEIKRIFRENMPDVIVDHLADWPHVMAMSAVNSKVADRLKIIPVAGWCVVNRSTGSSGVVNELDKLGELERADWSAALGALFDGGLTKTLKYKPVIAPVLLSANQEHLLNSARSNDLTVCHGPPGTGKSFTLAAIAIDHIARGETVLIVSKKDHAVDVLYEKTHDLLGSNESLVRAGRSDFLKSLKDRVAKILAQRYVKDLEDKYLLNEIGLKLLDVLSDIMDENEQLTREYEKSISRGEISAKPNPSWHESILKWWHESKVRSSPILLDLARHLEQLHQKKEKIVRQLISAQQVYQLKSVMTDTTSRNDIKNLLTALKKRKSSEQTEAFSAANFDSILKVFPIWFTSLSDLHRVLPLQKEIFDVVIIDEASQCDIASVFPAIQRAKRVVIAGDQKQLRHVAFISNASMNKFARSFSIDELAQEHYDYRNVSLMDLAVEHTNESSQVALLNEHFRSLKPIIKFSNSTFYQDELRLMRDRPWEIITDNPLEFMFCKGSRGDDGVNDEEISAVMSDLENLMEQSVSNVGRLSTIGILSPFRAQVDALTEAVNDYAQRTGYGNRLSQHQLKVGTAHSFQGEERDVMLISLALGKHDHFGSRNFLEQEDVFNVSITRAKHRQIVYHSILPQDLPNTSLLARYLSSSKEVINECQKAGKIEVDKFTIEFSNACNLIGITTLQNESVASIPVDVLLEKNGKYLGVDLVGFPGYSQAAVEINCQQILQRVGIRLVPVGYVEWQIHQAQIIEEIEKLLIKS